MSLWTATRDLVTGWFEPASSAFALAREGETTALVPLTWTPPGIQVTENVTVVYTERTVADVKGDYAVPTIVSITWPEGMPPETQTEFLKKVYHGLNDVRRRG